LSQGIALKAESSPWLRILGGETFARLTLAGTFAGLIFAGLTFGRVILAGVAVYRCDDSMVQVAAVQIAEKLGFVSGHRFSDAVTPAKSDAPLEAGIENRVFPQTV
jgi:hypothetical protein